MGFYAMAASKALENITTENNIRMMYKNCVTNFPGDFVHRVLLYEDGNTKYHRIMNGSTELADIRKGNAVVAVQVLEVNKEEMTDIEAFVETNTKAALFDLRKLADS